jgi:protein TonB
VVEEDENKIFTVVEQQPEFQGGYEAMMNFIKKNMRYPASARRMGVDGTVYVSFVVSKDGSISEVKTIRGISADCDKEAMRVVSMMPPWRPGKQNGKPVFVRFVLPIKFKLN